MFNDLKDKTAIKIEDLFVVKLNNIYGKMYQIRGVRVNGGVHTVPDLEDMFEIIPSTKKLSHYELDGVVLSTEYYNEYNPESYYSLYDENYTFESLEHEYQVKKEWERIKEATQVFTEIPEKLVPIEIEIVGEQVDTGSDFISTPYQLGQVFFYKDGKGLFSLSLSSIAMDEVRSVCSEFPEAKIEIPTHSHLSYLKVNDKYVFSNNKEVYITGKGSNRVFTKLDEAQKAEKHVRDKIRARMLIEIKPVLADSILLKELHQHLTKLKTSISDLEVKQKSRFSRESSLKLISEHLSKIEQIVMDK